MVAIKLGDTVYGLNEKALGVEGYADHRIWRKWNQWGYFEVGVREIDDWIKKSLSLCWHL